MKLEVLLPALGVSLVLSYLVIYKVLEIRSDTVRWISTMCLTILMTFLCIKTFVGDIRPFYGAFGFMVMYLLVQRRMRVRQPRPSEEPVTASTVPAHLIPARRLSCSATTRRLSSR